MFGRKKKKTGIAYVKTNPNLGKTAVDVITGFSGKVVAACQYITGCDQYLLVPKCGEDNKYPDSHWFDVNRLEFSKEEPVEVDTAKGSGSCEPAPLY